MDTVAACTIGTAHCGVLSPKLKMKSLKFYADLSHGLRDDQVQDDIERVDWAPGSGANVTAADQLMVPSGPKSTVATGKLSHQKRVEDARWRVMAHPQCREISTALPPCVSTQLVRHLFGVCRQALRTLMFDTQVNRCHGQRLAVS
jgi:hypothetical protein